MAGSQQPLYSGSSPNPSPSWAQQCEGSGLAGPIYIRRAKQRAHFPAALEM